MGSISNAFSSYKGFDHVHWYVGNAKQAASFYITRFGFQRIAYRGLETGSRTVASHVIRNGDITFVFTSPLQSAVVDKFPLREEQRSDLAKIHAHLESHDDGVAEVTFEVEDVNGLFKAAVARGAEAVVAPRIEKDSSGSVRFARVTTFGDTKHTLIRRSAY